jgi:hypothetical protein
MIVILMTSTEEVESKEYRSGVTNNENTNDKTPSSVPGKLWLRITDIFAIECQVSLQLALQLNLSTQMFVQLYKMNCRAHLYILPYETINIPSF